MDHLTSSQSMSQFSRTCVEIYLDKKLILKFIAGALDRVLNFEYEGLHVVCFSYGKYGHKIGIYPDNNLFDVNKETDKVLFDFMMVSLFRFRK